MKIISTCLALIMCAVTVNAKELHIVSAGSKTGSLTMQATAYANDLASSYQLQLSAPGNFCQALTQINPAVPTMLLWAHDFEAAVQSGRCPVKLPANIRPIRFNKDSSLVCSLTNADSIFKGNAKIAHTVPKKMFSAVISNINTAFGTAHQGVMFNGSGQVRLALLNGEVDLAILTNEHAEVIRSKGGSCKFVLDDQSTWAGVVPLQNFSQSVRLRHSFDTMIYAVNMSDRQAAELKRNMQQAHKNCNSAIGQYTRCDSLLDLSWEIDQKILSRWQEDVADAIE
jgi:hypothetical protein